MGFHKAVKLEPCHTAHTALGDASDRHISSSGVVQQGGNVFLRDWDVKILAAGSDAAVIPGSTAWLQAFFLDCDVLTTRAISTIVWHLHLLVLSA